jgi:DNA (cytosine-5)-methyltransferase 1
MARIICEVQPRFVFVENSPMLTSRGLGTVLGDLATMGFDAKWGVLGADSIGACHHRERIWILAYTDSNRLEGHGKIGNTKTARGQEWSWASEQTSIPICPQIQHENAVSCARDTDEVAARVDRLKAIGNGQVPLCAATAWKLLSERI